MKKGILGKLWLSAIGGSILFFWIGKQTDILLFTIFGAICFFAVSAIPVISLANFGAKSHTNAKNTERLRKIEFQLAGEERL